MTEEITSIEVESAPHIIKRIGYLSLTDNDLTPIDLTLEILDDVTPLTITIDTYCVKCFYAQMSTIINIKLITESGKFVNCSKCTIKLRDEQIMIDKDLHSKLIDIIYFDSQADANFYRTRVAALIEFATPMSTSVVMKKKKIEINVMGNVSHFTIFDDKGSICTFYTIDGMMNGPFICYSQLLQKRVIEVKGKYRDDERIGKWIFRNKHPSRCSFLSCIFNYFTPVYTSVEYEKESSCFDCWTRSSRIEDEPKLNVPKNKPIYKERRRHRKR
jgi:hypothetical protein